MSALRKAVFVAAALASFTAASAAQSAFAQTNRYTRVEASSRYLGPNGVEDRGFGGVRGSSPFYNQGVAPYAGAAFLGGQGPVSGGY